MTSNKNITSTSYAALVPPPTLGEESPTKCSTTLDFRSNFSNPLALDPTPILSLTSAVPRNISIPDATNTSVDPTEAFEITVSNITEALPLLIAHISYEPETVILQLEYFNQELINASDNHKASVPRPDKNLLLEISAPLKILTIHIQDHQTHLTTALNLNPHLKAEDTI